MPASDTRTRRISLKKVKWFSAVAVVCTASVCNAQSSVNIYGALDTWVGQQRATGTGSQTVLNSGFNPNILGFAGAEDLGGGLKAGFVLEGSPALDTGTFGQGGKIFGRQSVVYLSGADWGRVNMGRLHMAGRAFGVKYGATGWLTTDPIGAITFGMGSGLAPAMTVDGLGGRVNNAISYESPRFGGFNFSVLHAIDEKGTLAAGQVKVTVLGASWAAGPFSTDVVVNRFPEIAGSQLGQTDYALGATYDFGFAKVFAAAISKKASAVAAPGATAAIAGSEATDRAFMIGANMAVGSSGRIGASIGRVKIADAHRGRLAANVGAPFAAAMDDLTAWSVAYTYLLSKRTSLFAAYGTLNNDALGRSSLAPGLRPVAGGKSSILAAGVRHSF